MLSLNVLYLDDYKHLRRKNVIVPLPQHAIDEKIYDIMIKASGLPDFNENYDYYVWYATQFCFVNSCEIRDLNVEKKLKSSNPHLQLPR